MAAAEQKELNEMHGSGEICLLQCNCDRGDYAIVTKLDTWMTFEVDDALRDGKILALLNGPLPEELQGRVKHIVYHHVLLINLNLLV